MSSIRRQGMVSNLLTICRAKIVNSLLTISILSSKYLGGII